MTQLTKHHPESPNGQDDESKNNSGNVSFQEVLNVRLSRRNLLKGGFGAAATSFMGFGLSGCLGGGGGAAAASSSSFSLGFTAVAKSVADALSVPSTYTATALYSLGDPINMATAAYANDGSDTAASFQYRAGDHHDGMAYFGLNSAGLAKDLSNSTRGLLCMNHENITQPFLHTAAELTAGINNAARVVGQIDKEVHAHGVSVIEIVRSGSFSVNKLSGFNRRYTAASPMDIYGPASGNALMRTPYSTGGTATRGTLNNCANGVTPWGTYLTCEENWAGYFRRLSSAALTAAIGGADGTKAGTAQTRYIGSGASTSGSYGWANPSGGDVSGTGLYTRWNLTATANDPTAEYYQAANTFGWVVEIDPFDTVNAPRKRTAMGRFGHEGAMPAKAVAGKPLVYYMGDDSRGEYIYKYVSTQNWDAADANGGYAAGNKYLDDGKLYVATFAANGTGTWTELTFTNPTISGYATYAFADQGDVLINCRLAADAVGATKMDRPEWTGVHPTTGDIYVTLTNNSNRGVSTALDAANPRYYNDGEGNVGNPNGHIIRIRETGSNHAATTFNWDVYLFGAESDQFGNDSINISGLTADNDFSSPDGLWFSQATPGLMWLQTDDGAYTNVTNCMMLAALPGAQGDGGAVSVNNLAVPTNGNADQAVTTYAGKDATTATLRRFLVGPKGCEITGITETPDGKTIFVNIQHPGENTSSTDVANNTTANYQSHWPATDGVARPRSTTVVITKNDGGLVGA